MSKFDLSCYETIIFDCDGVLLNSNQIKSNAFYKVAYMYGHLPALKLKEYHQLHGGISRYEKFEYLFSNILDRRYDKNEIESLLSSFSKEVYKELIRCEVASNLKELREKTKKSNWMVVSGSDQNELRKIFAERSLDQLFDYGIFGSPADKDEIINREKSLGKISENSLFIGDSLYDYEVAKKSSIHFVFLSKWSEVNNWENIFNQNVFHDLEALMGY